MPLSTALTELVSEARGRRQGDEPVVGASGGPAGNARLIAWTGLSLLVLILAQLVTLLDVNGLISWHVVIGILIVGLTVLKTAGTTWRAARYYTGHAAYRAAAPPPTPLRLLGPLLVVTALGLLGSGIALIALGAQAGRRPFVTVLGFGLDTLTLHQVMFFAFIALVGLHVVARLVPAVTTLASRVQRARAVPGGSRRILAVLLTLAVAAIVASLVLGSASSWRHDHRAGGHHRQSGVAAPSVR